MEFPKKKYRVQFGVFTVICHMGGVCPVTVSLLVLCEFSFTPCGVFF
jgi:hypothetical protein